MRHLLLLLLLASPALAQDWQAQLSPRLRQAFQPMLRSDWKPQREVELTAQEKRQWQQLWSEIQSQSAQPLWPSSPPKISPRKTEESLAQESSD